MSPTQFSTIPTTRVVTLIASYQRLLSEPQPERAHLAFRRWLGELRLELARRESTLSPAA